MRSLQPSRAYRLEIAPGVWRDLGAVPGEHFKRMQAELENVAELVAYRRTPPDPSRPLHKLRVGAFEGIYEVDPERRVLRLMSVHPFR